LRRGAILIQEERICRLNRKNKTVSCDLFYTPEKELIVISPEKTLLLSLVISPKNKENPAVNDPRG